MHRSLLPHVFLTYCVISGLVGVSVLSLAITIILVVVLENFRLAPPPPGGVKRVLNPENTLIIAHRGAAHDAPENTLVAFKKVGSA